MKVFFYIGFSLLSLQSAFQSFLKHNFFQTDTIMLQCSSGIIWATHTQLPSTGFYQFFQTFCPLSTSFSFLLVDSFAALGLKKIETLRSHAGLIPFCASIVESPLLSHCFREQRLLFLPATFLLVLDLLRPDSTYQFSCLSCLLMFHLL